MRIRRFNEKKDILDKYQTWYDQEAGEMVISIQDCEEAMKEFAKFHVKEALKEASKPYNSEFNRGRKVERTKDDINSILNSYPIDKIN
jgi:hypothetical protein